MWGELSSPKPLYLKGQVGGVEREQMVDVISREPPVNSLARQTKPR